MANKKKNATQKKKATMQTRAVGDYANAGGKAVVSRRAGPVMRNIPLGGVCVSNTEQFFGQSITLPANFTKVVTAINPCDTNFPWLRGVARNYAKYRWKRLILSWVPFVGTTTQGYVSVASAYDSEDAITALNAVGGVPSSSQPEYTIGPIYSGNAIRSHESDVSSANWTGIEFDVKRIHDAVKWFYTDATLTFTANAGNEARLNQCVGAYGIFQYDTPAPVVAGSWYMSYDIELIQPVAQAINP